jgi:hypothetical protein
LAASCPQPLALLFPQFPSRKELKAIKSHQSQAHCLLPLAPPQAAVSGHEEVVRSQHSLKKSIQARHDGIYPQSQLLGRWR